jgi:nitrous oxidase accessory protein
MEANRFEYNQGPASFGLLLKDISDSSVKKNTFQYNSVGVYLEGSNRIKTENNWFEQNGWAVKIMANCQDNNFTANNFLKNSFDVATNSTLNFNTFDGNYWNKYNGYDLNQNGAGDVPYRPVRLFSVIVENHQAAIILLNSFFIDIVDVAESVFPVLTPNALIDANPRMRIIN